MKYIYLSVFIIILLAGCRHSSNAVIGNPVQNIFYHGVSNPVEIAAEGYDCGKIDLICTNGKLTKTGDCNYMFSADSSDMTELKVVKISGRDTVVLKSNKYRIDNIGLVAYMSANDSKEFPTGMINKGLFEKCSDLNIRTELNFAIDVKFKVNSYNIIIVRNNRILNNFICSTPKLSEDVKSAFSKLQKDDVVLIADITVIHGTRQKIAPLEFIIQ
ncbi:MAG: hypothetical protein H7321_04125 [Bacteroidia bacterium]|nr:hypothetical protein [Bacteroidia bacterium]